MSNKGKNKFHFIKIKNHIKPQSLNKFKIKKNLSEIIVSESNTVKKTKLEK